MYSQIQHMVKTGLLTLLIMAATFVAPASIVYGASAQGVSHGQGQNHGQAYGLNETQPSNNTHEQVDSPVQNSTAVEAQASTHAQGQTRSETRRQTNSVVAHSPARGNNGTIKIHEQGTPAGTENNDPKVCSFNVEGFGFDANQTGYLTFNVQGGDKPTGTPAGPYSFGPTNASGFYASQYFNLADGHYKATLYGKQLPSGQLVDVKAKSKVFKVRCGTVNPVTCPTGTTWNDADNDRNIDRGECVTPGGRGSGNVQGANDANGQVLSVSQLASTGVAVWITAMAGLIALVAVLVTTLRFKHKSTISSNL